MPHRRFSPGEFIAELSHRKVTRVALMYAVGAWSVIEVADTVLPRLGFSDWTVTLVIVLVGIGFPIALVLSWLFELTDAGLQRAHSKGTLDTDSIAADATPPTLAHRRAAALLGLSALVGLVGIGAYARYAGNGRGVPLEAVASIAVLPFADVSSTHDQEYFADGMTEELLNVLAGMENLHVAARSSSFAFKGKNFPIGEAAARLGVRHVLEGSVSQEGDRLRITVRLVKADDEDRLWAATYDRELRDVFAVQKEISHAIAAALRLELGLSGISPAMDLDSAGTLAHDLYLRGRYHWNRRTPLDMRRAVELMEQAVAADPTYARAWFGLGAAYELLPVYDSARTQAQYVGRARAALTRALELDPRLGEAHATLGDLMLHTDWDYAAAERAHQIALTLAPNYATAHSWYAEVLEVTGRMEEALEHRRMALRLDPLDPKINMDYAGILLWLGRFEEAIAQLDATVALDPTYPLVHEYRVLVGLGTRRYQLGESAALRFAELMGRRDAGAFRMVFAGLREEALRPAALRAVESLAISGLNPELVAAFYVALGDHDAALQVLGAAVARHSGRAPWFPTHPNFAPLRGDPRFIRMTEEVGLHL